MTGLYCRSRAIVRHHSAHSDVSPRVLHSDDSGPRTLRAGPLFHREVSGIFISSLVLATRSLYKPYGSGQASCCADGPESTQWPEQCRAPSVPLSAVGAGTAVPVPPCTQAHSSPGRWSLCHLHHLPSAPLGSPGKQWGQVPSVHQQVDEGGPPRTHYPDDISH